MNEVDDIYQRICKIAKGAAMMTETEVTIKFDKACSNYIPNRSLEKILHNNLLEAGIDAPTDEEVAYAEKIWESLTKGEKDNYLDLMRGFGYSGDGSEFEGKYYLNQSHRIAKERV